MIRKGEGKISKPEGFAVLHNISLGHLIQTYFSLLYCLIQSTDDRLNWAEVFWELEENVDARYV